MSILEIESMAVAKPIKPQAQQEFLRNAMQALDMTRPQFAERIGTKPRTLDNWLLPTESKEFRGMPDMVWKFVREILENNRKK